MIKKNISVLAHVVDKAENKGSKLADKSVRTYVDPEEIKKVLDIGEGGGSSVTLYNSLGENTDGPITQQTARRAIYGNNGMMAVTIVGQDASSDTQAPAFSTHVGSQARGTGNYGVSIGNGAYSNARMAVAIGKSSGATADSAIALGSGSYATSAGEINVYTGGETDTHGYNGTRLRLIRGLHAGVQDNDAVNVAQLNDAIAGVTINPATTTTLGGVIVGTGLSVDQTGVLSANSATLYPSTGQNTDGAMTQKAVTDIIGDIETILTTLNSGTGV